MSVSYGFAGFLVGAAAGIAWRFGLWSTFAMVFMLLWADNITKAGKR